MKRFFNTLIVLFLMFAGPLMLANAWIWLLVYAGVLKTLVFALLLLFAAVAKCTGPALAAKYVVWRIKTHAAKAGQS